MPGSDARRDEAEPARGPRGDQLQVGQPGNGRRGGDRAVLPRGERAVWPTAAAAGAKPRPRHPEASGCAGESGGWQLGDGPRDASG